jgi:general secretion pathway protein I
VSIRCTSSPRGFTLLEVLVAIAILGLGLTVILGSQVGLFTNSARAQKLGVVTNLARCKMSEVEVRLLALGYQLTDESDEGPCCSDDGDDDKTYHCSWKVERVTLPELPDGTDGGSAPAGDGGLDLGRIDLLTGLNQPGGQALARSAKPADLAKVLSNAPSPASLTPLLMTLIYPTLKPMLEASIRKVTVTVGYKEGKLNREFAVTQYVTNPQQGQLDPTSTGSGGGAGLSGAIPGLPATGTGTK